MFFQFNYHGFIVEMNLGGLLSYGELEEEEFDGKRHKKFIVDKLGMIS